MQLAAKIRDTHTSLSRRRVARLAHRRLSAELAAFTSPADRAELDQMLERHSHAETREIQTILGRLDAQRQRA